MRKSGRDPGPRPYASINAKPVKQRRTATIHILPADSGLMRATGRVSRGQRGSPHSVFQVNFDLGFLRQTGRIAPLEEGRPGQP